jgi:hypothetical protein
MKKIVFPNLPSGNCIFCDDIRYEINGKRSFIGVYGTHLYTSEIPFVLPKFCLSIDFRDEVDVAEDVALKILFEQSSEVPNDEDFVPTEFDVGDLIFESSLGSSSKLVRKKPKGFMMKAGRFDFQISPLHIASRGRLKVRAYRGDVEVRLGTLIVELAEAALAT